MAHFDLCDEMVRSLGSDRQSVLVLRSARHVLGVIGSRSRKAKNNYPPNVHERIINFMMGLEEIYDIHENEYSKLIEVDGIDIGEATLAAAICSPQGSLIVSAERTFLEAIGKATGCESAIALIKGRWVCFEQVLLKLIDDFGFPLVRDRALPAIDADHRLRAFFGSGTLSTEQNVKEGLINYRDRWNLASGGILASLP